MKINKNISFHFTVLLAGFLLSGCTHNIQSKPETEEKETTSQEKSISIPTGTLNIALHNADAYDKEALVLGIHGSANTYLLNISDDLSTRLKQLDKSQKLNDSDTYDYIIHASSANHRVKCVYASAYKLKCRARVMLEGTITNKAEKVNSFSIDQKADTSLGGDFSDLLRIASQDAITELVSKIQPDAK